MHVIASLAAIEIRNTPMSYSRMEGSERGTAWKTNRIDETILTAISKRQSHGLPRLVHKCTLLAWTNDSVLHAHIQTLTRCKDVSKSFCYFCSMRIVAHSCTGKLRAVTAVFTNFVVACCFQALMDHYTEACDSTTTPSRNKHTQRTRSFLDSRSIRELIPMRSFYSRQPSLQNWCKTVTRC